jgi:hypothetical protein
MQGEFNYVQKGFELFPKLTKIMFGWEYDMAEIENKLSHVKESDSFIRDDLLMIMDAREWDFKKFWPNLTTAIVLDKPIGGIFNLGWEGKKKTISELYKLFLHIEVVSVILRFIDPQNYAIISPPVEKFFSLQPKDDHIEYYINYLNLLKKTSKHFQLPDKLADVDMALWCLSFIQEDWGNEEFRAKWIDSDRSIIELILHRYRTDRFFKKTRLTEVLLQAYRDIEEDACDPNRIFLADCLDAEEIDPELAMITVAFCFENLLWKLIEETGKPEEFRVLRPRQKWINKLRGIRIFETYPIFNRCLDLRDRAVHPWLKNLNALEREEFIDSVEKLIRKKKANKL